jgi:hypothetical protein
MTQQRYNIRCDAAGQDILAGTSHALTELINTVAPPISEHEVVQVWMTHRMKGYDGVESVVYQGVMKVGLFPPQYQPYLIVSIRLSCYTTHRADRESYYNALCG